MRFKTRATGVAALAAVWLAASSASAAAGFFVPSPEGGRARPGEDLSLAWTLDGAERSGRDEMELVLSLDDGATFPIRVLDRLDPSHGAARWRVPALPTEHARLALRAGEDGGAESEEIVAVSDSFAIAATRFGTLEELFAVGDEWRTREALEGAPARPTPQGLASQDSVPEVASADRDKSEPETSPAAGFAPSDTTTTKRVAALEPALAARPPLPALSAPLPLRL
jgi:hypothetical protein